MRLDVLWLDPDAAFRAAMIPLLQARASPRHCLAFPRAETNASAMELSCRVDRVVCEVCLGMSGGDDGVRLLETIHARSDVPLIAFSHDLTPDVCARLVRIGAVFMIKRGAFAQAHAVVDLIVEAPRGHRAGTSPDVCETFLEGTVRRFATEHDRLERLAIARAIARARTISEAARRLGMPRTTLQSKLEKLGLSKPRVRARALARNVPL